MSLCTHARENSLLWYHKQIFFVLLSIRFINWLIITFKEWHYYFKKVRIIENCSCDWYFTWFYSISACVKMHQYDIFSNFLCHFLLKMFVHWIMSTYWQLQYSFKKFNFNLILKYIVRIDIFFIDAQRWIVFYKDTLLDFLNWLIILY